MRYCNVAHIFVKNKVLLQLAQFLQDIRYLILRIPLRELPHCITLFQVQKYNTAQEFESQGYRE